MLGAGKMFIMIKMMEIKTNLDRGNDKSKRTAKLIDKVGRIFGNSEMNFEMMLQSIQKDYEKMSERYNREFYQALGGKKGEGKNFALSTEDAKKKIGIDVEKLVDGIDPEGFMQFQAFIPFTKDAGAGKIDISGDDDSPSFPFMLNHINYIFWNILFTVYYPEYYETLYNKMDKYDPKATQWN